MSTTLSPSFAPFDDTVEPISAPATLAVRRVRWVGRIVAILLCSLHVYTTRHAINEDGISYLDVASAYARGDFGAAVNYYWSPLYSWLLAGMMVVLQPLPYWDGGVAHLTNLIGFLVSMLAFEWLLSEALRTRRARHAGTPEGLPDWLVTAVGYVTFIYVARWLIPLATLTPDTLVAAVVYAGVALLLRMRREPTLHWPAPTLGVVLGLGYLTKTVLLPLSVLFLGILAVTVRRPRQVLIAGAVLALIAGPYVALLSFGKGRLTIGETGRLNHLWYVGNAPHPRDFGANEPTPVFTATRAGTGSSPLWYDPSIWYEGASAPMNVRIQAVASWSAAWNFVQMFPRRLLAPTLAIAALALLAMWRGGGMALSAWMPLLALGTGTLCGYVFMGIAQPRLAGPFLLLLLFGVVLSLKLPRDGWPGQRVASCGIVAALAVVLFVALAEDARAALTEYRRGEGGSVHPHARVAETLRQLGVKPGDGVATLGDPFSCYWARLSGTRVIASVPNRAVANVLASTEEARNALYLACQRAGAMVLVSRHTPEDEPGWVKISGTNFAVRKLEELGLSP